MHVNPTLSRSFGARSARSVLAGLFILALACRPQPDPTVPPEVTVTGLDYAFQLPDSLPAGPSVLRFRNAGKVPHGMWPTLHFFLRSEAAAGEYHLGPHASVAHAEWFRPVAGSRPRASTEQLQGYISVGQAQDSLIIIEFNLTTRRIRGRFSFTGQELHTPGRVSIRGLFAGHVYITGPAGPAPRR